MKFSHKKVDYLEIKCYLCPKIIEIYKLFMKKKLTLAILALLSSSMMTAQVEDKKTEGEGDKDESAFTFTESQLGEDDDMSQNVTIVNSNGQYEVIVPPAGALRQRGGVSVESGEIPLSCL